MPYKTSCFALTATAFLAKQMTMDKKRKDRWGKRSRQPGRNRLMIVLGV